MMNQSEIEIVESKNCNKEDLEPNINEEDKGITKWKTVHQSKREEAESSNCKMDKDITESNTEQLSKREYTESGNIKNDKNNFKNNNIELFGPDNGPKLYPIMDDFITHPLLSKNLPELFKSLPIHGRPNTVSDSTAYQDNKIREFVGGDLDDSDFEKLAAFSNPKYLITGNEVQMPTLLPSIMTIPIQDDKDLKLAMNLNIVKKVRTRIETDKKNLFARRLKYRGVRIVPKPKDEDAGASNTEELLMPGTDLLFRVRVYRPFNSYIRQRHNTRHAVFNNDIVLLGRQRLAALRDRICCPNEMFPNVDVSNNLDDLPPSIAKELFPSGFLFISNVFYVDDRRDCHDISRTIREWAVKKHIGDFPIRSMSTTQIHDVPVKLGHPDVYVHQGNCEHLISFSEVRILSMSDSLRPSSYPHHTQLTHMQTIYCTTCAEFASKWVVTECERVPFDPTFFCDTCFKLYLYEDGKKICDFKAYMYKGSDFHVLKPIAH